MRKSLFLFLIILLLCGCTKTSQNNNLFSLNDELYGVSSIEVIDKDGFNKLIDEGQSFLVSIYMPGCTTSAGFDKVVKSFSDSNSIKVYSLSWIDAKELSISNFLEYYPSMIIYQNGQMIDYLDAGSNSDYDYFLSTDNLETWLSQYVDLKNGKTYKAIKPSSDKETSLISTIDLESRLENVKKENGKVNIYLFWGDGCPHCKNALIYLDSIKEEYGKYFNLYAFEIWYNDENQSLMKDLAQKMGDNPSGVPYIIIGEKTFGGFNDASKDKILSAILQERSNDFDVYLND